MRMAANNYADINGDDIQTDIIQKTLKYFFNMEGTSEGKQTVVTGIVHRTARCTRSSSMWMISIVIWMNVLAHMI